MSRAAWLAAVLVLGSCIARGAGVDPSAADAARARRSPESAKISAGFSPYRLGAHTTLSLSFEIHARGGGLPSALTGIDFHYPADLGLATSGLGLATCDPNKLAQFGPETCPPNSQMGSGTAVAEFQVSPEVSEEKATLALVAGPSHGGYVKPLLSAGGISPVDARIVMSLQLLPGELRFDVPLVPVIPGTPDVAVVEAHLTIGGDLTYYERSGGQTKSYRPEGLLLPRSCPHGGFRFTARFSFLDGTHTSSRTAVRCPRGRG